MPKKRVIVGYVRVSTEKQVEVGRSLDDQKSSIRRNVDHRNLELAEIVDEGGASGWTLDRPQLEGLRARVRAGEIEAVVVSHIDRLTRNGLHLQVLLDELHNANGYLITAEDRFGSETTGLDSRQDVKTLGAIVSFAEWQRDRISDATKRAHANLKRSGKRFARDLYGFDVIDGQLTPVPAEIGVLKQIRDWSNAGVSMTEIARRLTAAGHRGKRGGAWRAKTVRDQLRRFEDPDLRELYQAIFET